MFDFSSFPPAFQVSIKSSENIYFFNVVKARNLLELCYAQGNAKSLANSFIKMFIKMSI